MTLPDHNYPIKDIISYSLDNIKGNIAIVSERGDIYSSAFMFEASKIDNNREVQFFRPCIFDNKTSKEITQLIIENNIEKFIYVKDATGSDNLPKIKNITLEKDFGSVLVYSFDNFEKNEFERCNFICLTREKICENNFTL
jgi:hypothetical protein